MTLIEELKWRGFWGDTIGNCAAQLKPGEVFYIGTDPTSINEANRNPQYPEVTSSLHCGHLAAFMCARLLQLRGLKPIVLVGGATARMGDPSGKISERTLLSDEEINHNAECIKNQLMKIIDFDSEASNKAIMVNNNDWISKLSFIDFERSIGKLITINYMMAKESVRKRFEREGCGISHLELSYMLVQAYDFVHLHDEFNCKIQLAGMDQIGNATVGLEYGRKRSGINDMCGLFIPLICDANGNKFGKSENGKAVFLDKRITTVYEFYQFWLNQVDSDAERFIKMFTVLSKDEIDELISEHRKNPQLHLLQKRLAKEVTSFVHSEEECNQVIAASEVLFGKNKDNIHQLDKNAILDACAGIPKFNISKTVLSPSIKLTSLLTEKTNMFGSKGDVRRLIANNGISINNNKINADIELSISDLISDSFILVKQGKKNYKLIIAS